MNPTPSPDGPASAPADHPEPLSAILAEMRDFADHRAADAGGERPAIELLRSYADRIEAAAERERENADLRAIHRCHDCERENAALCNAAAMREALEKLTNAVRNYFGWDDAPAVQDCDDPTAYFCAEMSAALFALAAPARNCDISRDTKETIERCLASLDVESSSASFDAGVCAAIGWMLAAPTEGGDHA